MNIEILIPDDFESYSDVKKEKMCLSCYELLEYMQEVMISIIFMIRIKFVSILDMEKLKMIKKNSY